MSENNRNNTSSNRFRGSFEVEEYSPGASAPRAKTASGADASGSVRPQAPNPVQPRPRAAAASQRAAADTARSARPDIDAGTSRPAQAKRAPSSAAAKPAAGAARSVRPENASRAAASPQSRPAEPARKRAPSASAQSASGGAKPRPRSAVSEPAAEGAEAARRASALPEWAKLGIVALVIMAMIGGVAKIILSSGTQEDRTIIQPIVSVNDTPEPDDGQSNAQIVLNTDNGAVPANPASPTGESAATPEPTSWNAALSQTREPVVIPDEDLRHATVRMAGDVIIDWEMLQDSYNMILDGYDFSNMFSMIGDTLSSADFTMINIEASLKKGKYGYSGYPTFTTPPSILTALKNAGCDMVTMCNNHMLDCFCDGLVDSVGLVEKAGLQHVGGFTDEEDSRTPEIIDICGIKVGFVCYTQTTNSVEEKCDDRYKYLVKYLKKSDFAADVDRARAAGAEVVIAIPHWGEEYKRSPETTTTGYAKQLVAAGADLIIGGHPHVVQPAEYITTTDQYGSVRTALCVYSLGNFLSQHIDSYTESGIVFEFTIQERNDGTFAITQPGYVPVFCWKEPALDANGNQIKSTQKERTKRDVWHVRVLPIALYMENPPAGMDEAQYQRMRQCWFDALEVMGNNDVMQVLSQ